MHRVCGRDTQDPGSFQRVQVYWVHDVHDLRHLARFRPHLLQVRIIYDTIMTPGRFKMLKLLFTGTLSTVRRVIYL